MLRTALKDSPQGPPTANHQSPLTATNRHQPPTAADRHQPPTAQPSTLNRRGGNVSAFMEPHPRSCVTIYKQNGGEHPANFKRVIGTAEYEACRVADTRGAMLQVGHLFYPPQPNLPLPHQKASIKKNKPQKKSMKLNTGCTPRYPPSCLEHPIHSDGLVLLLPLPSPHTERPPVHPPTSPSTAPATAAQAWGASIAVTQAWGASIAVTFPVAPPSTRCWSWDHGRAASSQASRK